MNIVRLPWIRLNARVYFLSVPAAELHCSHHQLNLSKPSQSLYYIIPNDSDIHEKLAASISANMQSAPCKKVEGIRDEEEKMLK